MANRAENEVRRLLTAADITVGGGRPWDVQVHDPRFFARVLSGGSLALGESYMDGWWECAAVDQLIDRVQRARLADRLPLSPQAVLAWLGAHLTNRAKTSAFDVGEKHYDAGNDLYRAMLDARMVYTCAYWKDIPEDIIAPLGAAEGLDQAQEAKLDLVCRKIGLRQGQTVLDIGCGWGSFARFAAERYGARVTGVTVSKEQLELGRKNCEGLPVELRLQDYRDVTGRFDHVVSLGMFEHVDHKNYLDYMKVVRRVLKDDGLFLLHTMGGNRKAIVPDSWIDRYIFPNSLIPSAAQVAQSVEGLFVVEDWHNFGPYYDRTLMAWLANFDRAWPQLSGAYDERFRRMWRYYLQIFAGGFRARYINLWQIVLSPHGVRGGYESVR